MIELSRRALNRLDELNVNSVSQLAEFTEYELWHNHDIGGHTLQEFREALATLGLELKKDTEPWKVRVMRTIINRTLRQQGKKP